MPALSCGIDWAHDHHDMAIVDEHGAVICAEWIGNDAAICWLVCWSSSRCTTRRPGAWRRLETSRALIRLVGAVLAEQYDESTEGRRYLGLEVLKRARLSTVPDATASTNTEEVSTTNTIPALSA